VLMLLSQMAKLNRGLEISRRALAQGGAANLVCGWWCGSA
jgi:hypothetical protein